MIFQGSSQDSRPFKGLLVEDVQEIIKALQNRIEETRQIFLDSNKQKEGFQRKMDESKSRIQRHESKLKSIRNDIKHYHKKKNDLESELQDIQDAGRIDTTSLEEEEEELKEAILKSSALEDEQKIKYDYFQSELKGLKSELINAEKKRDFFEKQMKDEERILNQYITNCQSRAVQVEQAKKNILKREKEVNDVVKLLENKMVVRQQKVDEASVKVFKSVFFNV